MSNWALIMDTAVACAYPKLRDEAKSIAADAEFRPWTEDYAGIPPILKRSKA